MCPAAAINLERYACLHCAGKQAIDYRDLGKYGNDPSGLTLPEWPWQVSRPSELRRSTPEIGTSYDFTGLRDQNEIRSGALNARDLFRTAGLQFHVQRHASFGRRRFAWNGRCTRIRWRFGGHLDWRSGYDVFRIAERRNFNEHVTRVGRHD